MSVEILHIYLWGGIIISAIFMALIPIAYIQHVKLRKEARKFNDFVRSVSCGDIYEQQRSISDANK